MSSDDAQELAASRSGEYWIETLGCPKNEVDSDKLTALLSREGWTPATSPEAASMVVVNTCAFVESARQESIDTILTLQEQAASARMVVTGCMAERYDGELQEALPEVIVAPFGVAFWGDEPATGGAVPLELPRRRGTLARTVAFDLLNLPRPASTRPWAYVKIAEGCDRACGFCAIPSFRGPQRSRPTESIVDEVRALGAREVVLVAQDLARYGKDAAGAPEGASDIEALLAAIGAEVDWVRLLYLYPSDLRDSLIAALAESSVPYFDLSLQHVSRPLLRRMRRWGEAKVFRDRIAHIRSLAPNAIFRSNFIVGYPGETEEDHEQLVDFVRDVELDWCGFFEFSPEEGTYAADLPDPVSSAVTADRLAELRDLQEAITFRSRAQLVGSSCRVLVDEPGTARSYREAPEIDGVIRVPAELAAGEFVDVRIVEAVGVDLVAEPLV